MYASRVAFHLPRILRGQPPDIAEYLRQRFGALARLTHLAPRQALDAAALDYRPQPYDGPVLLLRPADRPRHPAWNAEIGWRGLFTGDFQVHDVPGDHESMLRHPKVEALAALLRSRLP
jgi:thioesterase domain-containing protein